MKTEKIHKVLARAGVASRRKVEELIKAGEVFVNGKVAVIGQRITTADSVKVAGRSIKLAPIQTNTRVLLYYKPLGEICTRSDPQGRPTVFQNLPKLATGRWISIGRLDINSEGLLLFTNDGELANALMHPRTEVEREYLVRVHGEVTTKILNELQMGVQLEDGMARFKRVRKIRKTSSNQWYRVVVAEGRNRIVRRLWNTKKISVNRLIRIRFYDILLPRSLSPRGLLELGTGKVELLRKVMETNKEN